MSSKDHKMIFENWRRYVDEAESEETEKIISIVESKKYFSDSPLKKHNDLVINRHKLKAIIKEEVFNLRLNQKIEENQKKVLSLTEKSGGGQAAAVYSKLYEEHYSNMDALIEQSGFSELEKTHLKKSNQRWHGIAKEVSGNFVSSFDELKGLLKSTEAEEELPMAAESKMFAEAEDESKLTPEQRLEILTDAFPEIGKYNKNLLEIANNIETALESGDPKKIGTLAGRIANVIYNLAKNEKPANIVYKLRLRAAYVMGAAFLAELASAYNDAQAWGVKFATNIYSQYSAAYQKIAGVTAEKATQLYAKFWSGTGEQVYNKILELTSSKEQATGLIGQAKWKLISTLIQQKQDDIIKASREGVEPLRQYIESEPLFKKILTDLIIAKEPGIAATIAERTTFEQFQAVLEGMWAYITNAGLSGQIFFWGTIMLAITGLAYNYYTKDPSNPVALAFRSVREAFVPDLKFVGETIWEASSGAFNWVARLLNKRKELGPEDIVRDDEEDLQEIRDYFIFDLDNAVEGVV